MSRDHRLNKILADIRSIRARQDKNWGVLPSGGDEIAYQKIIENASEELQESYEALDELDPPQFVARLKVLAASVIALAEAADYRAGRSQPLREIPKKPLGRAPRKRRPANA